MLQNYNMRNMYTNVMHSKHTKCQNDEISEHKIDDEICMIKIS